MSAPDWMRVAKRRVIEGGKKIPRYALPVITLPRHTPNEGGWCECPNCPQEEASR